MKRFAKTKNGKIHVIWSDNTEGKHANTMDLISENQWVNEYGSYDIEWCNCENYPYSEILIVDTNLQLVKSFK